MSRIRSIHPGFWTDETFAALSSDAALLYLGILGEADDQGVFEWKPVQLRMRLRASKDGAVDPLLAELEAHNTIRRYELDGRQYGAVRNFRKYQRPKKPKELHPITPEIGTYLGSSRSSGEPEEDEALPFPKKGELAPQMEEGGGRMNEEGGLKEERLNLSDFKSEINGAFAPDVATLVKRAAKKVTIPPDRCWLKLSDSRVERAKREWFAEYGSELPLQYRGKSEGYLVPWRFVQ